MSAPLDILPDAQLDLLSLGALVHRLDPGVVPFSRATQCAIHVSGGEYNVAANLASCFRRPTAIATAMVDYPIGDLVDERVRTMGVTPIYKRFAHDGVRGPNMATVYSDRGFGARAPVVFYNRANEAAALLGPGDFDWPRIFAPGVRWFHSGGIFATLSRSTPALIVEAMKAARNAGAVVSFDLNYREKLWQAGGGRDAARETLTEIVSHVDVLIANEEELQAGLGISAPDAHAQSTLDPAVFVAMMGEVTARFSNLKVVATTLRDVRSANHHTWSAVSWVGGRVHRAPTAELTVLDRVGGGDGFASGFIHGLLAGESPERATRLGWAHGALVTSFPGDTTMATTAQVEAFAEGASARIQR